MTIILKIYGNFLEICRLFLNVNIFLEMIYKNGNRKKTLGHSIITLGKSKITKGKSQRNGSIVFFHEIAKFVNNISGFGNAISFKL